MIAHPRRHHFEPTKFEGGTILLDTDTGVLCSARFGMKWSDDNKKAVWAAGLTAKKTEAEYRVFELANPLPPPTPAPYINESGSVSESDYIPPTAPVPIPIDLSPLPIDLSVPLIPYPDTQLHNLFVATQDADSKYNELVSKADNEQVPDMHSSGIKGLPLCKNIH